MPTQTEKDCIVGYQPNSLNLIAGVGTNAYEIEAGQTRKGYLTNIKKSVAFGSSDATSQEIEIKDEHLDWQARFQDEKQRADNRNKNDWDIIAEMGGTQPVKTDRVEYLGQVDYEMNWQQITQSAPEFDGSSPLGTTGSFSFTKATGTLFSHKKFLQHGFIHILVNVNIDNYYENGSPKEVLKTNVQDIYRPGLAKKEIQLLKKQEISNNTATDTGSAAYQPAWAEYKRLPSFVSGQTQSLMLDLVPSDNQYLPVSNAQWHNFKAETVNPVVSDLGYFRNSYQVGKVFSRNNILTAIQGTSGRWATEPLINMSEHMVKTQLPIEQSVITGSSKAEQTR